VRISSTTCLLILCACTTSRERQKPLNAAAVHQVHLSPVRAQFVVEGKPGEVPAAALVNDRQ
jgi:hypothetical protein